MFGACRLGCSPQRLTRCLRLRSTLSGVSARDLKRASAGEHRMTAANRISLNPTGCPSARAASKYSRLESFGRMADGIKGFFELELLPLLLRLDQYQVVCSSRVQITLTQSLLDTITAEQ